MYWLKQRKVRRVEELSCNILLFNYKTYLSLWYFCCLNLASQCFWIIVRLIWRTEWNIVVLFTFMSALIIIIVGRTFFALICFSIKMWSSLWTLFCFILLWACLIYTMFWIYIINLSDRARITLITFFIIKFIFCTIFTFSIGRVKFLIVWTLSTFSLSSIIIGSKSAVNTNFS